jgi:lysophospholipase L1-like esterase
MTIKNFYVFFKKKSLLFINRFLKFVIILLIVLSLDYLVSFLLKTKSFWVQIYPNKYWRVPSQIYHHDLKANVEELESWGSFRYKLITNSLGFRDFEIKNIEKINLKKKRILLIGDSMTEGTIEYSDTYSGLLTKYFEEDYEILNAGVGSYSPTNYYYKIKYYLDHGYKFDHIIIFLDISDVIDEQQYEYDSDDNLILNQNFNKKNTQKLFIYLRDNFITFRTISLIRDNTEKLKNYIKFKYNSSIFFKKNFFSITQKDIALYRMINLDIGAWTQDVKEFRFNIQKANTGINRAEKNLLRIFDLAKKKEISTNLVIYPWPNQIYFKDNYYKKYWLNFSTNNKIDFIDVYSAIIDPKKPPEENILENYIMGDIHFNKKGNIKIFEAIKKKIKLLNLK